MGSGSDAGSANAGYFSRMMSKMSGSEVVFSVIGIWTDIMVKDIPKVPAKVRSAGADNGDTAEFWVDGKQIDYSAGRGVNIVAVDFATKAVISGKAYDPTKEASNEEIISDIAALPASCMVLMAVKGTGAEELSEDAWNALESCGAVKKEGHWHKGYALIGTRGGNCVSEARGPDVVVEGDAPSMECLAELVPPKEVSIESGSQSGSCKVDRGGMVILRWSNAHSYLANKALSSFKVAVS